MEVPNSNKTFRWIVILVLSVIVLAVVIGISWRILSKKDIFIKRIDYVIPGVPYIGIYNHKGKLKRLAYDRDSAVASVLEYWSPRENDFVKIRKGLVVFKQKKGPDYLASFVNGLGGVQAEVKNLKLEELRNYISSSTRMPLITFTAISENQPPESRYYPARVLIGLKESEKKLIFHDYWLGNNYEVSFDEYNRLLEKTPLELRNKYVIIWPKNLSNKLKEVQNRSIIPYPQRTEIMNKAEEMFKNYAMAVYPYYSKQYDETEKYFSNVINNPDFEEFFPPEYKVRVYCELAEMQLGKNDLEAALVNVQKSIEMNHDLDKPFKDWLGYKMRGNAPGHLGELTMPDRILGDIYMQLKDFARAKESYQKSLNIRPQNKKALEGLRRAQLALGEIIQ